MILSGGFLSELLTDGSFMRWRKGCDCMYLTRWSSAGCPLTSDLERRPGFFVLTDAFSVSPISQSVVTSANGLGKSRHCSLELLLSECGWGYLHKGHKGMTFLIFLN